MRDETVLPIPYLLSPSQLSPLIPNIRPVPATLNSVDPAADAYDTKT
jgi:hypothetical protein